MKKLLVHLILLFSCLFCFITSVCAEYDANKGSGNQQGGDVGDANKYGGLLYFRDIGARVTIYNDAGNKVSDSVDVVFAQVVYNDFVAKQSYNTLSSEHRDKFDYNKGYKVNWQKSSLRNKIIVEANHSSQRADISPSDGTLPKDVLEDNIRYWYNNIDIKNKTVFPEKVYSALNLCQGKYKCSGSNKYYAVFEPTLYIISAGTPYYGTAYELAYTFMQKDNSTAVVTSVKNLDGWINNNLPRLLVISGKKENMKFYNKVGLSKFCTSSPDTCLGNPRHIKKIDILKSGVGIGVYDWPIDKILKNDISCDVTVSINECGESSIYEASNKGTINKKECIVDNPAYSYIPGCNLYCSDEIITNFNGFYGNFIGNNVLGAIKSGKYLAIKSNPKITINKTCYQSKGSNECPDISRSFRNKLDSEYKTNKIYLTIDGKKYEFIGNSTISNNGYSSATITYEYKLDENINKYIDIETMKGITNPVKFSYYTNSGPAIITSKGTYGKYKYSFDVSETPLNKYTSSSTHLNNLKNTLKNTSGDKYNFTNNIYISYIGKKENGKDTYNKESYTNDDLRNATCTYVKYNTDEECICPPNKCCDSVTCEELDQCPPNPEGEPCTCTGEYGCYDDGKCTPIPKPTPNKNKEVCDPDKKVCFPNLIYRPISLIEPFPGINGNKRIPGNNWNKVIKTTDGKVYSYGDYYIRNRRGYKDYEIYQSEPLYVIKLDGTKIQAIRKYNDKHDYNDFELTCVNGENCVSKFLRGTAQDFSINLIDSGTCKNINNYNFNSCIKNKGE